MGRWWLGMTAGLAVLLAGIAAAGGARAQAWSDVLPTDMRFRIEMPAPVARHSVDEKEAAFAGARTVYEAALAGQNFDFDYVDYRPDALGGQDSKATVRALGRGAVEKAFPRDKYTYRRDEAVTLSGWDGYALDLEATAGGGVVMRTYLVKTRLYRLLATYGADPASKAAALRFADSFKVADTR
ncbi:MAG: hypothetical protein KIT36_21955 [Alphaproteobacteria bacterium]|nr:hypothetical protein [Alphaproteobacteria bacterium]